MKYTLEKEILTIFLEGELNSYTSEDVDKEIETVLKNNKFESIVLDCENLKYISSAGLRIIVRLKQQCRNITVRKPSNSVYDIFKMVGFDNIVKIEK